MTIQLPEPITAYFTADKLAADAATRCFAGDAVVKDVGHTYTGVAAIKQWKTATDAKYIYTCEPLSTEQKDGTTVVTCHLEGNFPGGRADLRFFFRLERGRIAHLEIIP